MARRPAVTQIKAKFLAELQKSRAMYSAFESLPRTNTPSTASGIHPKHLHKSREMVFLGIVGSWEEFLEQSLVRYAMGVATQNGYQPTMNCPAYGTRILAYQAISRKVPYNPSTNYLNMSNPSGVASIANRLFSAHTFTCLGSQANLLNAAINIRNRVAHKSSKSRAAFVGTAKWFLQPQNSQTPLSQSFCPGALLAKNVQRHFGAALIQGCVTHFEAYLQLYEGLANTIVP
jgi:hypothetical protein